MNKTLMDWQTEGKARFQIGNSFYRSSGQVARDLGVLAAAIYKQETGQLRVLDAMAGSGVRSLRYWLESQADWIWTNDGNPEISAVLHQNLEPILAKNQAQITCLDAKKIFFNCYDRQDFYDLVDVDGFGSPASYLSACLDATKIGGLLYLTSTDGRTVTGHEPESCLALYGSYSRSHPAIHEQGLRILFGSLQQVAATQGFGIEPIFSLFVGETYRLMVRLISQSLLNSQNYGFLGYCHHCGDYQTVFWRDLGRVNCPYDRHTLTLTGPLWLGALQHSQKLQQLAELATSWNWIEQSHLLKLMADEAELPPYFYTLGEIGRRGKLDIPKRSYLIQALQTVGYRASPTHIYAQAIKTNANLQTCILTARHPR
ncbi:tRNA (guanine-N1)-methyltransferase [Phormidesmis sp. 146-12]